MSGQLIPPNTPKDLAHKMLDNTGALERMKAERGILGSLWGVSSHIPHNIAAFLIVALLIAGVGFTIGKLNSPVDEKSLSIKDFWAIITPLITLAIGYLFGDKKRDSGD
jgi:hypothetical protein